MDDYGDLIGLVLRLTRCPRCGAPRRYSCWGPGRPGARAALARPHQARVAKAIRNAITDAQRNSLILHHHDLY